VKRQRTKQGAHQVKERKPVKEEEKEAKKCQPDNSVQAQNLSEARRSSDEES
jgi:hypothetical protein